MPVQQVAGADSVTIHPTGLNNGGKVTKVTVTDAAWTALPPTPLTGRNAIRVQNQSTSQIRTNYDFTGPLPAGYEGMWVKPNGETFYDITDSVVIYAKAEPGAGSITEILVEEIS